MSASEPSAPLLEVFSSIQGEGLYVGRRQIFVRTVGCNLACEYCDTPAAREEPPLVWSVFSPEHEISSHPNRASVQDALSAVRELERISGPHHSVPITGGEPLLHPDFTAELSRLVRESGSPRRIHLETNASLPDALPAALLHIDVVAADVKLASSTLQRTLIETHAEFLSAVLSAGKELFVKIIVTDSTDLSELHDAARMIARIGANMPVVLQPAACLPGRRHIAPTGAEIAEMQRLCLQTLRDVRVIPQCHRILGVR